MRLALIDINNEYTNIHPNKITRDKPKFNTFKPNITKQDNELKNLCKTKKKNKTTCHTKKYNVST